VRGCTLKEPPQVQQNLGESHTDQEFVLRDQCFVTSISRSAVTRLVRQAVCPSPGLVCRSLEPAARVKGAACGTERSEVPLTRAAGEGKSHKAWGGLPQWTGSVALP